MKKETIIFGVIFLAIVIVMRLHLALVRYFDADEFAYMHWAWLLAQGKLPYRDFFFYSTPTYPLFLLPIFLFPAHQNLLLLARLGQLMVTLFTGLIVSLFTYNVIASHAHMTRGVAIYTLTGLLRFARNDTNRLVACLLSLVTFLMFPMTLDKTIDIRPDTLMTFFYLLSTYLLIIKPGAIKIMAAGLCAGLSVIVFPKIVFGLPALGFLLLTLRKWRLDKQVWISALKDVLKFGVGFSLPVLALAGYLIANGLMAQFITAITKYSVIVNAGKLPFNFISGLSPWPLVYLDRGGASWPWMVNTGLWITSAIGLFIMFKTYTRMAFFIGLYFLGGLIFLYLFPAPYLQYFIPLVPFVSVLSAYVFFVISRKLMGLFLPLSGIAMTLGTLVFLITLMISLFQQYQVRVAKENSNAEQLGVVRNVLKISQPTDTFYDMVGSYVFRPDGYFICCHPYTEFAESLPEKPLTLRASLEKNKTKYLIMDRTGLLFWKPNGEDLNYLQNHFRESQYPKIYIRK